MGKPPDPDGLASDDLRLMWLQQRVRCAFHPRSNVNMDEAFSASMEEAASASAVQRFVFEPGEMLLVFYFDQNRLKAATELGVSLGHCKVGHMGLNFCEFRNEHRSASCRQRTS